LNDLEGQGQHSFKYVQHWYNAETETSFCLAVALDGEAARSNHRDTLGPVADEVVKVVKGT
jgi:hypothetical protein